MATVGAPSARRNIWPSAVVLDAKSRLVVFANERLVERFEKTACRNYLIGLPHEAPMLVSCLVCTVVVHEASALAGQRRICVMAVSVTYAEREQHLQRGLPHLSEGDFSDVREVLAEFIMNHKEEQPRVILGVLGAVAAPEFASLAELALEQHTCWTAVGPAPTADTPFAGGVGLTGNPG
ncbi:MAG: hypothetical protein GY772_21585, partial [bacterium]|nr:hypothetical protein [bacterium]